MRILPEPRVYKVGQTGVDVNGMEAYLRDVGGDAWFERIFGERECDRCRGLGTIRGTGVIPDPACDECGGSGGLPALRVPGAEALIEFMGRLCYKSWEPGLNANVTKVREDRGDYLLNILRSGHGSVLAHATFNFAIRGGSRVFTAEMNRHAVGTAISEQSLRYVRLDDLEFWGPTVVSQETLDEGRELVQRFEDFYENAIAREFTPDMEFTQKKLITSALRRWAPMGLATEEGWTGNVRAIRHVIEMRTAPHAEEEIRIIAGQIARIMQTECPLLFGDYDEMHDGSFVTDHRKV